MIWLLVHSEQGVFAMAFKAGVSGNPGGRPKKNREIFENNVLPHTEALIEKGVSMALAGDAQMLKLFLERMLPPKPREESFSIKLPSDIGKANCPVEMATAMFKALESEDLTPTQFKAIYSAIAPFNADVKAKLDKVAREKNWKIQSK